MMEEKKKGIANLLEPVKKPSKKVTIEIENIKEEEEDKSESSSSLESSSVSRGDDGDIVITKPQSRL